MAFRTGENEYYINNEKVRLKDITELLTDSGTAKESFNIISQGKIDEIDKSNSKSETMDANRGSRRGIFGGCFVFWCAEPAREADGGAGDAE
jgi:hypothetical protein